jgi:hypothetical protein
MKGSSLLVVCVMNFLFLLAAAGGCSRQSDAEPAPPPDSPIKAPIAQILAPTELPIAVGELRRFERRLFGPIVGRGDRSRAPALYQ